MVTDSLGLALALGLATLIFLVSEIESGSNAKNNCDNYYDAIEAQDAKIIEQWAKQKSTLGRNLAEKLSQVRKLSPFGKGGKNESLCYGGKSQPEICYTEECLDSAILLLKSIKSAVDPCDNFYNFACGRWIADNPVPPKENLWNSVEIIREKINQFSQDVLEAPIDPSDAKPIQQAKALYSKCVDQDAADKTTVASLLEVLRHYGEWPAISKSWNSSAFDVNKAIADSYRVFEDEIFFKTGLVDDDENSTIQHINVVKPKEFFLPTFVLLNPEKYPSRLKAQKKFFVAAAKELAKSTGSSVNDKELEAQADDVIKFETRLVQSNEPENSTFDAKKADFATAQFNFENMVDELFSSSEVSLESAENLYTYDEPYMSNFTAILDSTDIRTVANYFHWRLVASHADFTTRAMIQLRFQFDQVDDGFVEERPLPEGCAYLVSDIFDVALGAEYVRKEFQTEAKEDVEGLVKNVQDSLMHVLNTTTWLDEDTRKAALLKLSGMTYFVAHPDWLLSRQSVEKQYEGLTIAEGDLVESLVDLFSWRANKALNSLSRQSEVQEWILSPATDYYVFQRNAFAVRPTILQPPFYTHNGLQSLNYGGIGSAVGHSMSLAFDSARGEYDLSGSLTHWWSNSSSKAFKNRTKCFVRQYNGLKTSVGDVDVDGALTLDENIGDNAGIRQSFSAYQNWIRENNGGKEEARLPGLEIYTPQQLFFLNNANGLCENVRNERLLKQLQDGPYSPAEYRVNFPLKNFQEFAQNWHCPVSSNMNPPAEEKCVLW